MDDPRQRSGSLSVSASALAKGPEPSPASAPSAALLATIEPRRRTVSAAARIRVALRRAKSIDEKEGIFDKTQAVTLQMPKPPPADPNARPLSRGTRRSANLGSTMSPLTTPRTSVDGVLQASELLFGSSNGAASISAANNVIKAASAATAASTASTAAMAGSRTPPSPNMARPESPLSRRWRSGTISGALSSTMPAATTASSPSSVPPTPAVAERTTHDSPVSFPPSPETVRGRSNSFGQRGFSSQQAAAYINEGIRHLGKHSPPAGSPPRPDAGTLLNTSGSGLRKSVGLDLVGSDSPLPPAISPLPIIFSEDAMVMEGANGVRSTRNSASTSGSAQPVLPGSFSESLPAASELLSGLMQSDPAMLPSLSEIASSFTASPPNRRRRSAVMKLQSGSIDENGAGLGKAESMQSLPTPETRRRSVSKKRRDTDNETAVRHFERISPNPSSNVLPTQTPSADNFIQLVKLAQDARRQKQYEKSIELYQAALNLGSSDYASEKAARVNLGLAIESTGRLHEAQEQYSSAFSLCQYHGDIAGQAEVNGHLGEVCSKLGQSREAETHLLHAFNLYKGQLCDFRGQSITASSLGCVYASQKDYRKSLQWHHVALDTLRKAGSVSHMDLSACYSQLALSYFECGDFHQARKYHQLDLAACKEYLASDLDSVVAAGKRLVAFLLATDEVVDAETELKKLVELLSNAVQDLTAAMEEAKSAPCTPSTLKSPFLEAPKRSKSILRAASPPMGRSVSPTAMAGRGGTTEEDGTPPDRRKARVSWSPVRAAGEQPDGFGVAASAAVSAELMLTRVQSAEALLVEVLVESAVLYSATQRWAAAAAAYERVLQLLSHYQDMDSFIMDILMRLGSISMMRGNIQRAASYFKQELEMRLAAGDMQGHAVALCNFGHCLTQNHEYNKGAMIQEYAYMLFKDVLQDRAGQATAYRELGAAFAATGAYESALAAYAKVLDIFLTEVNDRDGLVEAHLNLGEAYLKLGQADMAAQHLISCIELCEGRDMAYFEVDGYKWLGEVFEHSNRSMEALEAFRTAFYLALKGNVDIQQQMSCLLALGLCHLRRLAPVAALSCFDSIITFLSNNELDSVDLLTKSEAHSGAAEAWMQLENYEEALSHYDHYIEALKKLPGEGPEPMAIALINKATALLSARQPTKALECLQEAQLESSPDVWQAAYRRNLMGVAYVEMAEPKKAYEAFHQAEGLYKDVVKDEHEACLDRATNLSCLANTCRSLGKTEEAQLWHKYIASVVSEAQRIPSRRDTLTSATVPPITTAKIPTVNTASPLSPTKEEESPRRLIGSFRLGSRNNFATVRNTVV